MARKNFIYLWLEDINHTFNIIPNNNISNKFKISSLLNRNDTNSQN